MFKTARETLLQAYPNAPWRNQVQVIGVFALGVIFIALLAGIYLDISVQAATLGREIQEMQVEILALQRGNSDLETKLAELSSAARMLERAEEMGFRKMGAFELEYLPVPGYRPKAEAALAPPPGPIMTGSMLPSELNQTLFEWLQDKLAEPEPPDQAATILHAPEKEGP